MSTAECVEHYASTNSDISGIGVRVSFYLQTFLLVLLADRSWQDAPIALWTFTASSFGLIIAATANLKELSLFQAIQVSNLVWMANFGTFVALASYSRQKAASSRAAQSKKNPQPKLGPKYDYGVKFGAMLQTMLAMALTLYMWARADTFGPPELQPCSHLIQYALFVGKVPALGSGRIVGLTLSSILTMIYILTSITEMRSYWRTRSKKKLEQNSGDLEKGSPRRKKRAHHRQRLGHRRRPRPEVPLADSEQFPLSLTTNVGAISPSISDSSSPNSSINMSADTSITSAAALRRPKRRHWSSNHLDPMLVGIIICQILLFVYFVVSSELLLVFNRAGDGDGSGASGMIGFGQILALVVVLPSLLSVIGALRENGFGRLAPQQQKTHKRGASAR